MCVCVCVKFCYKLGNTFTETFQLLNQAYGEGWERVSSTKKARMSRSKIKVILVVIFDWKGIVHHGFLLRSQMIKQQFYEEVLARLMYA